VCGNLFVFMYINSIRFPPVIKTIFSERPKLVWTPTFVCVFARIWILIILDISDNDTCRCWCATCQESKAIFANNRISHSGSGKFSNIRDKKYRSMNHKGDKANTFSIFKLWSKNNQCLLNKIERKYKEFFCVCQFKRNPPWSQVR